MSSVCRARRIRTFSLVSLANRARILSLPQAAKARPHFIFSHPNSAKKKTPHPLDVRFLFRRARRIRTFTMTESEFFFVCPEMPVFIGFLSIFYVATSLLTSLYFILIFVLIIYYFYSSPKSTTAILSPLISFTSLAAI